MTTITAQAFQMPSSNGHGTVCAYDKYDLHIIHMPTLMFYSTYASAEGGESVVNDLEVMLD